MAKRELHSKAIEMRKHGMSYSQIRAELGISKAALSVWLRGYPLPEERIRELRDLSARRIERCRQTKALNKDIRLKDVFKKAIQDIGGLSEREIFLCGLFLYWGEGGKTESSRTTIANTDPDVLRFFIRWLEIMNVSKEFLKVYVHLYSDMDIELELQYWSHKLGIPLSSFRKPYIKASKRSGLSYKQKFTHGTCNVIYGNRDIAEYISASLEAVRIAFADRPTV